MRSFPVKGLSTNGQRMASPSADSMEAQLGRDKYHAVDANRALNVTTARNNSCVSSKELPFGSVGFPRGQLISAGVSRDLQPRQIGIGAPTPTNAKALGAVVTATIVWFVAHYAFGVALPGPLTS